MPRMKEFDRDQALQRAAEVFWSRGYEAASTDELLAAMGIGRQSMYNAFGDKRRLYLEALQYYQAESGAEMFERLRAAASPAGGAVRRPAWRSPGRAPTNAVAAAWRERRDGVRPGRPGGRRDRERRSEPVPRPRTSGSWPRPKRRGEVRPDLDERAAARFLHSTLVGLRVSARSGAAPEMLHDIATVAIDGLRAR
jgi:Transcriptional regulator